MLVLKDSSRDKTRAKIESSVYADDRGFNCFCKMFQLKVSGSKLNLEVFQPTLQLRERMDYLLLSVPKLLEYHPQYFGGCPDVRIIYIFLTIF